MSNEENIKFIDVIRDFFGRSKVKPTSQKGSELERTTKYHPDKSSATGWFKIVKDWYEGALSKGAIRRNKYQTYEFLDDNLAEAAVALNIVSDNIVSGAIGGLETFMVHLEEGTPPIIEDIINESERRTNIKETIWDMARDLSKYGDEFEEVIIVQDDKGQYWVDELKKLPVKEIYADVDDHGSWNDPDYPYVQKKDIMSKDVIKFDWWRILHAKIGRGIYGVDHSIFANASQRLGKQMLWIDDSMVLARLTRAWMRRAWGVDTKTLGPEEAFEYIERFKSRVEEREIIDRDTGQIDMTQSPLLPDQDIFYPKGEGSSVDLHELSGDLNIANIEDVKYFQRKFFMATGIPKAYAGLEEGTRSKATLSQIDIQFARQVRRKQNALIPVLKRFYELVFVLNLVDPASFKWSIVFPELNTTDELMNWEMMKLKASVAEILMVKLGSLNDMWLFKEVLGFTDEEIDEYASYLPSEEGGFESMNVSPKLMNAVKSDPLIRMIVQDMRDVVAYKKQRDDEIENMKPVGIEKKTSFQDKWK